jgi:bacillithiol system protein YtxJ
MVSDLRIRKIASREDWTAVVEEAGERPLWLFKHSLICPLSAEGLKEFESFVAGADSDGVLYSLIEVQNARELSNELARELGVRHESPQAILLLGDRVCWHGSHWSVSASKLACANCDSVSAVGVGSE